MLILLILILFLIQNSHTTTEWFGDLRAHLNPPRLPPFYDITYEDTECPFGIQSNAIPEFVYFGEMVATKSVKEHSECLQMCLETSRCKAVNFFEPFKSEKLGFCELLSESQYDNPRLMRPFRKAVYYENIRCQMEDVDEMYRNNTISSTTMYSILSSTQINSTVDAIDKSTTYPNTTDKDTLQDLKKQEPIEKLKLNEAALLLKKLAEKVREFNRKFQH